MGKTIRADNKERGTCSREDCTNPGYIVFPDVELVAPQDGWNDIACGDVYLCEKCYLTTGAYVVQVG